MDDTALTIAPLDTPHGEGDRDPNPAPNRDPNGSADEWLTINAAARRLGVTATAIRNRIKRGTLATRPNGNFGKLVRVPLTLVKPVTLTPGERVTLTPENPAPESLLTVTLTILSDHVTSLKAALAKAEAELELLRPDRERADRLEVEAAVIPGLRETIEAMKSALEREQGRFAEIRAELAEIRAERQRLLTRSWWQRLVG